MAREKDEGKRQAILAAAKRLFAERGFHGASVSDLARETGLPVGSIYTYFENKDAVAKAIVEEGWETFFQELVFALSDAGSPEDKFSIVLNRFLPALFRDVDLISIILAEAGRLPGLEDKLGRLAELFSGIVREMSAKRGRAFDFPPKQAMAAITLYFLGSLDTVRLTRDTGLAVTAEDILEFIRLSVENTFDVKLEPSARPS